MAKFRRPSQRTIDIYNQLVQSQNKVRKALLKIHRKAEETQSVGRLPALVIPKKARKYKNIFSEGLGKAELSRRLKAWWSRYRGMKEAFSDGLNSYLKNMVFAGYRDLWKEQIGELPSGAFGRFSKEQIAKSDLGTAMEVYNALFTRGADFFMALLFTQRVTEFKYIYDDLVGKVEKNYYLEDQMQKISPFLYSPKAKANLMKEASEITGYNFSKAVVNKARKVEEDDMRTLRKAEERAKKGKK